MGVTTPMMLAARNGFIVLIVLLFAVSVYQFIVGATPIAGTLWVVGVAVFYASKYYYSNTGRRRSEETTNDSGS